MYFKMYFRKHLVIFDEMKIKYNRDIKFWKTKFRNNRNKAVLRLFNKLNDTIKCRTFHFL